MGIDRLEPTIEGKSQETKTVTNFFLIKEPKGERWTDEYYKATFETCFTHMGANKRDQDIWEKGNSAHVE